MLLDAGLPLAQFLGPPLVAVQFGGQRDNAGVDTIDLRGRLLGLVVPAPATRWRRPADRPCQRPADRGSGPGRRAGDPNAFGAPRRGIATADFEGDGARRKCFLQLANQIANHSI